MKSKLLKEKTAERTAQSHLDIEAILKEKYAPLVEATPPVPIIAKEMKEKTALNESKPPAKVAAPAPDAKKLKTAAPRAVEQKTMKIASAPRITKTARPVGQGVTKKRDTVRVSVDFPRSLYEQVVERSDAQAQTLREFLLGLVRAHF